MRHATNLILRGDALELGQLAGLQHSQHCLQRARDAAARKDAEAHCQQGHTTEEHNGVATRMVGIRIRMRHGLVRIGFDQSTERFEVFFQHIKLLLEVPHLRIGFVHFAPNDEAHHRLRGRDISLECRLGLGNRCARFGANVQGFDGR